MKNILTIVLLLITTTSFAQRWGTKKSQDNTGRILTFYKVVTVADAVGIDTIKVIPNGSYTYITSDSVLVDSVAISLSTSKAQFGDEVILTGTNSAGGTRITVYPVQVGAGNTNRYAPTASKRFFIVWVWNGTAWVEKTRTVQ